MEDDVKRTAIQPPNYAYLHFKTLILTCSSGGEHALMGLYDLPQLNIEMYLMKIFNLLVFIRCLIHEIIFPILFLIFQ